MLDAKRWIKSKKLKLVNCVKRRSNLIITVFCVFVHYRNMKEVKVDEKK